MDQELAIKKNEEYKTQIFDLTEKFKEDIDSLFTGTPFTGFKDDYIEVLDEILSFDNFDLIDNLDLEKLRDISVEDEEIVIAVNKFIEQIEKIKYEIKKVNGELNDIFDQIFEIIPKFMYFSTMDELEDEATWEELNNNEKYKTLRNLLKLSDIDFENIDDFEDRNVCTDARNGSAKVTGLVNESWTQEEVEIDIYITNTKVVISVKDDKVKRYINPSSRSQGFQWFLSFYINFNADSEELKNTIILLDDPGVYLHASGQKDLIKTLEKISSFNQILISTHSPFLIDVDRLERIRLVSNSEHEGTVINEKFHKSDYDAFAPIRASIGMTLGDSLFFDRKTLMVEGITDNILIRPMSELLLKKGLPYLDTSIVAIQSVNSANKARYFMPFLLDEKIDHVVLLDYDDKGKKIAKELTAEFGEDVNTFTYKELNLSSGDLEIEDLFDFEFYLKAVNISYKKIFKEKIGVEFLDEKDISVKSFRGIKNYFRTTDSLGSLNKVQVSNEIVQMIRNGKVPSDKTINNFIDFFNQLNEKLNIT